MSLAKAALDFASVVARGSTLPEERTVKICNDVTRREYRSRNLHLSSGSPVTRTIGPRAAGARCVTRIRDPFARWFGNLVCAILIARRARLSGQLITNSNASAGKFYCNRVIY